MNVDYKPRFSFEISWDQKTRADKLLAPYGLRKALFSNILDDVLDIIEAYGGLAIGVLLSGHAKPREIVPLIKKASDIGKSVPEVRSGNSNK